MAMAPYSRSRATIRNQRARGTPFNLHFQLGPSRSGHLSILRLRELRGSAAAVARPGICSAPEMASGEVHRTQLAHERTYLAWWRTGLAGIAAGFGIGRVLPEVVSGTNWPLSRWEPR